MPNVARFIELAESFKQFLVDAGPDESQQKDLDYLLTLGELFTLIPYGQLICEQAALIGLPEDTLDQIFDVLIRDFSGLRGGAPRQDFVDRSPAGVGPVGDHQAGRGPGTVQLGLGEDPGTGRRIRDAPLRKVGLT